MRIMSMGGTLAHLKIAEFAPYQSFNIFFTIVTFLCTCVCAPTHAHIYSSTLELAARFAAPYQLIFSDVKGVNC